MFENRSLKLDLFALSLVAIAALLGASLLSYNPLDPPSTLADPPLETASNACGRVGALAADMLYRGLGYTALYFVGSLAVVGVLMTLRRDVNQPVVRSVGWVATLTALATLTTLALPNTTPGPEVGSGGYLGAMGAALLETHFALAGAYILAVSALVAGLLLCTDYVLLRAAAMAASVPGARLLRIGRLARSKTPLGVESDDADERAEEEQLQDENEYEYEYEDEDAEEQPSDEDWEDEEIEEEEEEPTPLKVRTPDTKVVEEAAEESAAAEDDQPPTESSPAPAKLRSKLSSALRIKKRRGASGPTEQQPERSEREDVIEQLDAAEIQGVDDVDYELPPLDLLLESDDICYEEHEKEVRRKAKILEKTFRNFGFNVKVVEIETGPVIAQYEVQLEAGLRLSRITGLADDLAIALRVPSVRIVAPIPGKNTVGIEVPNENRQLVRLREVIEETNGRAKRMKIPIYLGKDVSGNPLVVDLTAMPHLLIAGRTGTGKSVCLNSIIVSMLMSRGPDEVRMLMIDPKMVELSGYKKLPHLMHPVVTDMRKAEAILAWAVDKMEERYQLLARAGVRHISVYNQLSEEELRERIVPTSEAEWENIPRTLPFIVIVADEMADLMMTAGKDVEQHIIRLAQKSRAVGIHLILATQKPTVDVITGLIKSNLPARLAFQVASRTDSRVVLDEMGADKLLGNGDMLFLSPGTSQLLRGQGTFLSDDEITRVTDFVGTDAPQFARELIELKTKEEEEATQPGGKLKNRDDLYEAAVDVVVREQRGSVSLLQRCLGIGYGRAARLIDYMAEDGIVGEYNGSQAREVMLTVSDWEAMNGEDAAGGKSTEGDEGGPLTVATVAPKPRRSNRIIPGSDEPSDLEPDGTPARRFDGVQSPTSTPSFTGTPVEASAVLESATAGPATAVLTAPWEEEAYEADDALAAVADDERLEDEQCEISPGGQEELVEFDESQLEAQDATSTFEPAEKPQYAAVDDQETVDRAHADQGEEDQYDKEEEEEKESAENGADDSQIGEDAEDESEWEYEDEDEASADADEEAADGDEEWEYEEEEVDEADEEGEWEYEEEDEDEASADGDEEATDGDEDEWEYEEESEEEVAEWEDDTDAALDGADDEGADDEEVEESTVKSSD